MKALTCEICGSTDIIKQNGVYACQRCGTKYSAEEIKKMMGINDENAQHNAGTANNKFEEEEEIPIHTEDSPNRFFAKVIKVGHETYTTASVTSLSVFMGGEPSPVFVNGPDEVGHIGAQIFVENIAGKTIKYATVYLTPYNSVGDQVHCTVEGHSTYGIEITGPLTIGQKWEGYSDGMWYNNSIVYAKIDHVHVIYMDGTQEIYEGREFYDASNTNSDKSSKKIGTVIFHGYSQPLPLLSKVTIRVNGVEIGTVKRNETLSWSFEGNARIDLKQQGDFWKNNVLELSAPSITNVQLEGYSKNLIKRVW